MKKIILIFISIITTLSFTSCKGTKEEVEKLAVVLAMGFDLTPEDKYMLTAQILNPQKLPSSSKGDHEQPSKDILVFSSIGDTPEDAIDNLSSGFGKSLYFGHSQYIVIGSKLAETGLGLLIDSGLRAHESRPSNLFILTKDMASNIITRGTIDEKIPSNSIENLLKLQSSKGYSPLTSRLDFANALSSETAAPIMSVIELNKNKNIGATFNLEGTAVFKKDKLIGYMNIYETRGMQWIKGKVKTGNITATTKDNGKITFAILKANSEVKPIVKDDTVTIAVTIEESANITEMTESFDPMKNYQIIDELNELQKVAIENEIKLALNAAQNKYNADVFDFGGKIYRDYPKIWRKIEKNWADIFPTIKVEIKVNSSIKRPGLISKTIK